MLSLIGRTRVKGDDMAASPEACSVTAAGQRPGRPAGPAVAGPAIASRPRPAPAAWPRARCPTGRRWDVARGETDTARGLGAQVGTGVAGG